MKKILLVGLLLLGTVPPAFAQEFRDPRTLDFSKAKQDLGGGGPFLKMLQPQGGTPFFLIGGLGKGYLTENFYLGGAGCGGINTNGKGGLGYGGFLSGYEWKTGDFRWDASMLVGGGGGGITVNEQNPGNGSFAIEPGISLLKTIGGGAKVGLGLSYLYFPSAASLSGPSLSLRLEFKELSFKFPIDD